MKNDELMPLAPDLQALLRNEQAAPPMPAELQSSIAARLADSIAAPGIPEAGEPGSASPSDSSGAETLAASDTAASLSPLASLAAKPALLAATAFGIGLGTGVVGTTYYASNPEPAPVQPALVQYDAAPAELPTPDAATAMVVTMDAGPVLVTPPPKAETPRPRSPGRDSDLAAERSLLELARTAITRSNAKTALTQLEKHARLYRRGRLAEERDALWVQALALDRSYEEASRKATAFKKKYPKSLFLPVIDHALKEAP